MPVIAALSDLLTPDLYFFLHLVQIAVFLIILRNLDVYEREPYAVILAMFTWGALIAGMFAPPFIGAITGALPPDVDAAFGAAIAAPIAEEFLKGAGLLVAVGLSFAVAKRFGVKEFGGLTDGLVYGAAVGFGFAFTENLFYFVNFAAQGGIEQGLDVFLLRTDFTGFGSLLHAIFTGAFGAGLGAGIYASTKARRILYPIAGLAFGMAMHGLWNGSEALVTVPKFGLATVAQAFSTGQIRADLVADFEAALANAETVRNVALYGSILLAGIAIYLWLRWERSVIRAELWEEVHAGLLTEEEYNLLPEARKRFAWYWQMLQARQLTQMRALRHLHDKFVELAFTKHHTSVTGGARHHVDRARAELAVLRGYTVALSSLTHPAAPAYATPPPPDGPPGYQVGHAAPPPGYGVDPVAAPQSASSGAPVAAPPPDQPATPGYPVGQPAPPAAPPPQQQ